MAKFSSGSAKTSNFFSVSSPRAYRLTAVIKTVVDATSRSSIIIQKSTFHQAPKVKDPTRSFRVSTLVNSSPIGRIPRVTLRLLAFIERRGRLNPPRSVESRVGLDVEAVAIRCDA